jgi:hypothetical protein
VGEWVVGGGRGVAFWGLYQHSTVTIPFYTVSLYILLLHEVNLSFANATEIIEPWLRV